jgi:hypothetical protein
MAGIEEKGAERIVSVLSDLRVNPVFLATIVYRKAEGELALRLYSFITTIVRLWAKEPHRPDSHKHIFTWADKAERYIP